MLRIIPTTEHASENVDITIKAFEKVAEKLKKGSYEKTLARMTSEI